jgi:hypothetical protein
MVEQGEGGAGIEQLRQGLVGYQATGAGMLQPYFLALLAEGWGKVGHSGEGLRVLTEALTLVEETGERVYKAELYRLKGTLTLQSGASLRQVQRSLKAPNPNSQILNPKPRPRRVS